MPITIGAGPSGDGLTNPEPLFRLDEGVVVVIPIRRGGPHL